MEYNSPNGQHNVGFDLDGEIHEGKLAQDFSFEDGCLFYSANSRVHGVGHRLRANLNAGVEPEAPIVDFNCDL